MGGMGASSSAMGGMGGGGGFGAPQGTVIVVESNHPLDRIYCILDITHFLDIT